MSEKFHPLLVKNNVKMWTQEIGSKSIKFPVDPETEIKDFEFGCGYGGSIIIEIGDIRITVGALEELGFSIKEIERQTLKYYDKTRM